MRTLYALRNHQSSLVLSRLGGPGTDAVQSAKVYIGSFSFPWEPFEQFFKWLPYYKVDSLRHHRLVKATSQITRIPPRERLASQLYRTLHLSATDPRDKVFGIVGISQLYESVLVADYAKSVDEVFTDTAALLLEEHRFSIYCFAPLHPPKREIELVALPRLPSWVPDLCIASAVYHKQRRTSTPPVLGIITTHTLCSMKISDVCMGATVRNVSRIRNEISHVLSQTAPFPLLECHLEASSLPQVAPWMI